MNTFIYGFSLGYGARFYRPIFAQVLSWQKLEIIIGTIMWAIAAKLVFMR